LVSRLALCIFALIGCFSTPALAEKRVALVIGNSAYRNVTPLDNPRADAKLMAETLRGLGFTLVGGNAHLDLDKAQFDSAVQAFGTELQGADVALFYYAGHGVEIRHANYLVPIGANPVREADVDFQMVDANLVLRQMEGSGTRLNLVILDACRNNPFGGRGLRATASGLAQMQAPEGTLISFATQPGSVAIDGVDGNSPYTRALAAIIRRPGLDIFQTFNQVGLAVMQATGNAQQPWLSTSPIKGDFYFSVAPTLSTENADSSRLPDAAAQAWAATKDTTSQAVLEDFIRQFGSSVYGSMARARLDELRRVAAIAPTNAPVTRKTNEGDNDKALTYLAISFETGNGVTKDEAKAAQLYRKASDLGNDQAMLNLGAMYVQGRGVRRDYAEAIALFHQAADQGNAQAMTNLGVMYGDGQGVAKSDAESLDWLQKAARLRNSNALTYLALRYDDGNGVARDQAKAAELYREASNLGNRQAMLNLGKLYYEGKGVTRDYVEALRLFRQAADLGDPQAMINIGVMYQHGQAVRKDGAEAARWFSKAAQHKEWRGTQQSQPLQ
jgi:TPR repeat protein